MRLELRAFLSLILMLLLLPVTHAQELKAPSGSPQISAGVYEDSTEGLKLLLQDVLTAAKDHNRPKLDSFVKQMEIPNYEKWFMETFGQERGESWAEPYGRDLVKNERDFEDVFLQMGEQEGEFSHPQFE